MEEARGDAGLKPRFFDGPEEFRAWLEDNHDSERELWVGFYKKHTGKQRMSWSESVDQALCFGWIDGRGHSLGDESHMVRFTPRRRGSIWSKVNIAKVAELERRGLMRPAGRAAFEARTEKRSGVYSHERDQPAELPPEFEARLRGSKKAWEFFSAQPPSYRRTAIHLVVSAKREETRERRLAALIESSEQGERIGQLRPRRR